MYQKEYIMRIFLFYNKFVNVKNNLFQLSVFVFKCRFDIQKIIIYATKSKYNMRFNKSKQFY